jgi:hypothetical protein
MIPLQITIKGEVMVKKNSMGELWYRWEKPKGGGAPKKIPLSKPVKYYSKQYNKWARSAISELAVWKTAQVIQHPELTFPIKTPVMVWYVFFQKSKRTVDLSNLIAGVDDLLAGNSGLKLKNSTHSSYKILDDDSGEIIKVSHSSYFVDYMNPRLDVFICDYDLKKYTQAFQSLYPGMAISTGLENKEQVSFNFDELFGGDSVDFK